MAIGCGDDALLLLLVGSDMSEGSMIQTLLEHQLCGGLPVPVWRLSSIYYLLSVPGTTTNFDDVENLVFDIFHFPELLSDRYKISFVLAVLE